ncbi:MAG: NAD-dependent epimerase/dehydratase family protein [Terracidiphilus sp.]|nr:NAD-dependent epimerase/dehydratase family protein [Terracidiphilus sp.]
MDVRRSAPVAGVRSEPVLILGGSGFIGTRLTALLTAQQVPVRIGDLRPSKAFPELWTPCDVRRQKTLSEAARGAGAIVNLAAEHRDDVRPLSRYRETNVDGATQVCRAARNAGINKIVFTSSVAVYGFHPYPVDESGPLEPYNIYGKTKLEAESVYRTWAGEDPSRTLVIVRPSVVFGEGNRGNIYTLMRQIAVGHFLMAGSGKNLKSMAYVGNVAAFLAHTLGLGVGVHVFNYVDRPDMSTKELVEFIRRSLGRPVKTSRIPLPVALAAGYLMDVAARLSGRKFPVSAVRVRKFCANTQFAAELAGQSGFSPPYSLSEGLKRTIQFEFPVNSVQL